MKHKYLGLFLICLLFVINISGSHAKTVVSDEISITIPRNVITDMIKAALPLTLENGRHIKGNLWIHTIDQLKIGSNKIAFDMNIRGENIKLQTRLGKQTLLMDIGDVNAAFSCNASLRYDASRRVLYITPYVLQKPNENEAGNIAATLLQLLSLANGAEYPIEIQKFQPLVTEIGKDQFNIDLKLTKLYTENDKVVISGQPKVRKIKPPSLSGEKPVP